MAERSKKNLVLKEVEVKRGGKTFTQKRWVKPGEDEPAPKKGKKVEDTKSKGSFNIGDKLNFFGKNLTIENVSESQETIKLSDGNVYTFGAIKKFGKKSNDVKDEIKEKTKVKNIKPIPKKIIKTKPVIKADTIITKDNVGETCKVGDKITIYDKPAFITGNNNNSIIGYKFQDGETGMGSIGWLIEDGKIKTRAENNDDKKRDKETLKQIKISQKLIKDRETQFGMKSKSKYTNNKDQDKKISETINKLDNLINDGKTLTEAVKEIIGAKGKIYKPSINLPDFEKEDISEVNRGIKRLNTIISPKYKDLDLKIVACTTGRSYASPENNQIHLDSGLDIDSTLIHETGHLIESNYEGNHQVVDDFLRNRTNNLSDQKSLNEIYPDCGYHNNEITCKDNFIDPYIGKIYYNPPKKDKIDTKDLRSTEIFSMGIENFSDDKSMEKFYKDDKDHFAITLSILSGDHI